jgi:hypothetical protein
MRPAPQAGHGRRPHAKAIATLQIARLRLRNGDELKLIGAP